jgi:hypothetical protein
MIILKRMDCIDLKSELELNMPQCSRGLSGWSKSNCNSSLLHEKGWDRRCATSQKVADSRPDEAN